MPDRANRTSPLINRRLFLALFACCDHFLRIILNHCFSSTTKA
jgi:hypothetical protein